jgi:hypothetical protein
MIRQQRDALLLFLFSVLCVPAELQPTTPNHHTPLSSKGTNRQCFAESSSRRRPVCSSNVVLGLWTAQTQARPPLNEVLGSFYNQDTTNRAL